METDNVLPLRRDDPLNQLVMQDLDPLSISELRARVAVLEAEASRTRAKITATLDQRASAEALFKR